MGRFVIGRLFGWPEFAEDGEDVWLIHVDEPAFLLRVVHRPEDLLPSGDLADMYFPLIGDNRYAVGNLVFIEPRPADPQDLARQISNAIEAIHEEEVAQRLALAARPFAPSSMEVQREDIPVGFVAGVLYDSDQGLTDDVPWVVHLGPPPFALRMCDLNDEDLEPDDIWANVGDGYALAHLLWLSSMASDRDDIRLIAETAADVVGDAIETLMPDLLSD
jgi:hypothetical protein